MTTFGVKIQVDPLGVKLDLSVTFDSEAFDGAVAYATVATREGTTLSFDATSGLASPVYQPCNEYHDAPCKGIVAGFQVVEQWGISPIRVQESTLSAAVAAFGHAVAYRLASGLVPPAPVGCREPEGPEDHCGADSVVYGLDDLDGRCAEHAGPVLSPWGDVIRPDYSTWAPGELTEAFGR